MRRSRARGRYHIKLPLSNTTLPSLLFSSLLLPFFSFFSLPFFCTLCLSRLGPKLFGLGPKPPSGGQKLPEIEGAAGTNLAASRRARDVHVCVPSTAASDMAQRNRLDGYVAAHRRYIPVQVRCKTRKALKLSRYMRRTALGNLGRSAHLAGKVEQMSHTLALVALTHLRYMHNEHPFMLELASSPLVKLPCSPPGVHAPVHSFCLHTQLQAVPEISLHSSSDTHASVPFITYQ